ncbi:alpha/beta hydrolase [Streptomyces sp. NPDC051940]|uniref:alpha/beta fold hydrolase n=1 Tax=Streptomyces sp. NPDC051940 TaxID=3155675 RepID=UPI00343FF0C8
MAHTRHELRIDGRALSYVDFGGDGTPLVALHGHMSEGASFAQVAGALGDGYRVIAPDQRGHGDSDRAAEYGREGYLSDVLALLDHLGLERVVLLGHSLGGINAYQFAARHPERVSALVDIDGCAEIPDGPTPLAFVLGFPVTAPTREELLAGLGPAAPVLAGVLRENADGTWRLPFHPRDMVDSEGLVHGDHWADWTGSDCPALLIRGTKGVVPQAQAAEMIARRPGARLVEFDTDHFVYAAEPAGVAAAVREFLAR